MSPPKTPASQPKNSEEQVGAGVGKSPQLGISILIGDINPLIAYSGQWGDSCRIGTVRDAGTKIQ